MAEREGFEPLSTIEAAQLIHFPTRQKRQNWQISGIEVHAGYTWSRLERPRSKSTTPPKQILRLTAKPGAFVSFLKAAVVAENLPEALQSVCLVTGIPEKWISSFRLPHLPGADGQLRAVKPYFLQA